MFYITFIKLELFKELYINFWSMKCIFPISYSVENLFSFIKYKEHTNTNIIIFDSKLKTILYIKTNKYSMFNDDDWSMKDVVNEMK